MDHYDYNEEQMGDDDDYNAEYEVEQEMGDDDNVENVEEQDYDNVENEEEKEMGDQMHPRIAAITAPKPQILEDPSPKQKTLNPKAFEDQSLEQNQIFLNPKALEVPSSEQKNIFSLLKDHNLIINAVAGSGKTTTNLLIAEEFKDYKILLLTYNTKLKNETREKVQQKKREEKKKKKCEEGKGEEPKNNIIVENYHSFCVKYFHTSCKNDLEMIRLLDNSKKQLRTLSFNMLIIDEAQDLVPLYVRLLCRIMEKMTWTDKTRIVIVGDKQQGIYQYNKSDERYMTLAKEIFNFKGWCDWKEPKLSTSFRVTTETANFINKCMFHKEEKDLIISKKEVPNYKVKYLKCNAWDPESFYHELEKYFNNTTYKPEDIFVLAPSLNQNSPSQKFANFLTEKKILIYVASNENSVNERNQKFLKNKVAFSTFHQSKGLERKVVIVFGFDMSYQFYKKHLNLEKCPNELYVAVTRASEQLILIHNENNEYFPFLNQVEIKKTYEIIVPKKNHPYYTQPHTHPPIGRSSWALEHPYYKSEKKKPNTVSVTNLIKFLPSETIKECLQCFQIEKVQMPDEMIKLKTCLRQLKKEGNEILEYYEDVSDINGIAIPKIYENKQKHQEKPTPQLLRETIEEKYKLYQIQDFDWLREDLVKKCMRRLKVLKSKKKEFEVEMEISNMPELMSKTLSGRLDCVEGDNIWEFKCVRALTVEHKLQLALYMYMNELKLKDRKKKNIKKHIEAIENKRTKKKYIEKQKKNKEEDSEKNPSKKKKICKPEKINFFKPTAFIPRTMNYFLFNILSGEKLQIKFEKLSELRKMVKILFENKYGDEKNESTSNDDDFLKNIKKTEEYELLIKKFK